MPSTICLPSLVKIGESMFNVECLTTEIFYVQILPWPLTVDLQNKNASGPFHILTVYQVWLTSVKVCSV